MGVHSGEWGVVNGQSTVRNWQVNDTSDAKKYVASNTKRGSDRRRGVKAWTGSFEQYSGVPVILPGQFFTFTGFTAPDTDVTGANGTQYTGTAIVDQIVVTWNWGSGDILLTQINFSGHLGLTPSVAAALTDASASQAESVFDVAAPLCAVNGGAMSAWPNIAQLTLTITAANQAYVNSSTAGLTGRKAGPIDWTLAAVEQETSRTLFNIDDILDLELFTDATHFWRLKYGHVKEFSNIRVDPESGAIISRTANIEMAAYDANGNPGLITLPGAGSNYWP